MKVWAVVKINYTGTFMAIEKIFQNESDAIDYTNDKNRGIDADQSGEYWKVTDYYWKVTEHNLEEKENQNV